MPSQEPALDENPKTPEQRLFVAIAAKDFDTVKQIIKNNPKINLNCVDESELSPLQHACHFGDVDLTRFLLNHGADVNFAKRKDGYTPLMFASISSKAEVVKLLLERGVDTRVENCVNRTAAQMAAFVGQSKIVSIINSWLPYEASIEPYTKCRELEDSPRIPSPALGRLLHSYVVFPSLHPVRLLLFLQDNIDMMKYATNFIYTLDNLSSKSLKPPNNEECYSLKYYYLAYLLEYCTKISKAKNEISQDENWIKSIELLVRKLIKRENPKDIDACTKQLDLFILECLMKFPFTQLAIYKTMTFALTRREEGDTNALAVLTQTLNGPRMFNQPDEACSICGEVDKNKKCSRCKSIYYCGPSCQKADWFQHKKVCKTPEEKPLLTSDKNPNIAEGNNEA